VLRLIELLDQNPQNTDTYIAGTIGRLPNPELEALRADPEMQQLAAGIGVTVDDLLLFREMMFDRYASRYQDPNEEST
jgi:hypothetical protein